MGRDLDDRPSIPRSHSSPNTAAITPDFSPTHSISNTYSSNTYAPSTFSGSTYAANIARLNYTDTPYLQLVSPPSEEEPVVDIIFIHGLGGHSHRSWSWEQDLANFWPAWLSESELSKARVHTFGYSAKNKGSKKIASITDFAKDLLFKMKFNSLSPRFGLVCQPKVLPAVQY